MFEYLKNLPLFRQAIELSECSAIHAHFGLSGMLAVLQRKVPVIITFHGTDIRQFSLNVISSVASCFSKFRDSFHFDKYHSKLYSNT